MGQQAAINEVRAGARVWYCGTLREYVGTYRVTARNFDGTYNLASDQLALSGVRRTSFLVLGR